MTGTEAGGNAAGDGGGKGTAQESATLGSLRLLSGGARAVAKGVLGVVNRTLYPLWRRRARRLVDEARLSSRVLFVCHGNICRSPYAEGALRRELSPRHRDRIEVSSAGFIKPGRRSPRVAVEVAGDRSVDLSGHRSRLVEANSMEAADLVFVMERGQRSDLRRRFPAARIILLGDLDPEAQARRRILDPVAQPAEVFRDVYERIDRCVGVLAARIESRMPESRESRTAG